MINLRKIIGLMKLPMPNKTLEPIPFLPLPHKSNKTIIYLLLAIKKKKKKKRKKERGYQSKGLACV